MDRINKQMVESIIKRVMEMITESDKDVVDEIHDIFAGDNMPVEIEGDNTVVVSGSEIYSDNLQRIVNFTTDFVLVPSSGGIKIVVK